MAGRSADATPAESRALLATPRRADLVEGTWELFSSLRLTIPLVFALAAASVAGTFVNPNAAGLREIAGVFHERWWWPLFVAFELHDLFHSWSFTLLLLLLALNVVACTIERLPRVARVVMNPALELTEKVQRGLRNVKTLPGSPDVDAEAARVAAAFRARGYPPVLAKEEGRAYLFAQRGRFSRFGVWVVHASLLVMLGGGVVSRFLDWEGTVEVQEGGTFDSATVRLPSGGTYRKALPFAARVNRFDVEFYRTGTPRMFRSDVSVLDRETGRELRRQDVEVNHPLSEAGVTVYQASYREVPGGERTHLALLDRETGRREELVLAAGEEVVEGSATYAVVGVVPDYGGLGPAAQVRRSEGGRTTTFWVFQGSPGFDQRNRPDRFAIDLLGARKSYATGLQIAHAPGTFFTLWIGCSLFLVGIVVAFRSAHRRLWARVEPGSIVIAGSSHRAAASFERMLADLRAGLARAPGEAG